MNEITPGTLDRFISEMKARKILGPAQKSFFFDYFDVKSLSELDTRTLQMVNKKLSQHRLATVDDSEVFLHEESTQNDLWTRKVGN